jgi:small subunit ribosomal protein S18
MTSETPHPRPETAAAPTAPPEGGAPRPPAPMAPRGPRPSYGGGRPSYGGGGGDRGGSGGPGGPRRPRRKVCSFCVDKVQKIDYKDVGRIRRYISERGKIDPRRKSGSCAKHQRMLTTALKRARFMALLPYTADHVRGLMSPQARAMAGGPPPPKPERGPWRPAGEFRPAGDFRPAPRPFVPAGAPPGGAPAPQVGAPAAAPQASAPQPAPPPQPAAAPRRAEGQTPSS